ncbi:MAG: Fe-S cluster assembly protein HesB [Candidatus Dormibacteraeota bacterium]|nr:Fe-S cluster assembly protein HesB [Candidatus Dormibacteraeota bacterium]
MVDVTMSRVKSLAWTDDPKAAKLLAEDPLALLVGFLLDQQVPMEWAFGAPYTLKQRLGGKLDARTLATIEPERLVQHFLTKPPLHRYPAAMARRTQKLAQVILEEYDDDPARIWREAADAAEVSKRIAKLPGFSAGKARVIIAVLVKQLGADIPGWERFAPDWYSLADVRTKEDLLRYREIKRAAKRAGDWPPGNAKAKPKLPRKATPKPARKAKRA